MFYKIVLKKLKKKEVLIKKEMYTWISSPILGKEYVDVRLRAFCCFSPLICSRSILQDVVCPLIAKFAACHNPFPNIWHVYLPSQTFLITFSIFELFFPLFGLITGHGHGLLFVGSSLLRGAWFSLSSPDKSLDFIQIQQLVHCIKNRCEVCSKLND